MSKCILCRFLRRLLHCPFLSVFFSSHPILPKRTQSLASLVHFLQSLTPPVITLFVALNPSTPRQGKLPKDPSQRVLVFLQCLGPGGSREILPSLLGQKGERRPGRAGAALNRYTHQFTFLASVLGTEGLGRRRAGPEEPPLGRPGPPPHWRSRPAALPPAQPQQLAVAEPGGRSPAPRATRSSPRESLEHSARRVSPSCRGAPLRPQLLPGERVAAPVAPPLLRLLSRRSGCGSSRGPVPAVSAAARWGYRRDGLVGRWRPEPLSPARPAWPAPGTEPALRAPRPLLLALRPGGFPADEPRSGPSPAAPPQPQPVPRDRAENRVKSFFRIKRRSRRQDGDSWFWKEKNTCERPIFCRR